MTTVLALISLGVILWLSDDIELMDVILLVALFGWFLGGSSDKKQAPAKKRRKAAPRATTEENGTVAGAGRKPPVGAASSTGSSLGFDIPTLKNAHSAEGDDNAYSAEKRDEPLAADDILAELEAMIRREAPESPPAEERPQESLELHQASNIIKPPKKELPPETSPIAATAKSGQKNFWLTPESALSAVALSEIIGQPRAKTMMRRFRRR